MPLSIALAGPTMTVTEFKEFIFVGNPTWPKVALTHKTQCVTISSTLDAGSVCD
jgi:hypothetical protein